MTKSQPLLSFSDSEVSTTNTVPDHLICISLNREETRQLMAATNEIVFVTRGKIHLLLDESFSKEMKKGQMIFLPQNTSYLLSTSQEGEITICRIPDSFSLFHQFPFSLSGEKMIHLYHPFYILKTEKRIKDFLFNLIDLINDGLTYESLYELKIKELIFLIKYYYPDTCVYTFFYPAFDEHQTFRQAIIRLYPRAKNVKELAFLMNSSVSKLEKKFKKAFGLPPYQWMIKKKTEKVYQEICNTSKPLKVIVDEYGFSSLSQLSDFCRVHLGQSPTEIRNQKKI